MSAGPPIYLFCNLRYGAAFLRVASERGGRRKRIVVLSQKGPSAGAAALRAWWRRLRLRARTGLEIRAVDDVNAARFVQGIEPNSDGVVAGFNQIFRPAAIERFRSLVNVHPSLLPYYRGPTPSHWVLERGERASGFTLHRLIEAIDAGEILAQGVVEVGAARNAAQLDQRIADAAAPVVRRWLAHLETGERWTPTRVDAQSVYLRPADYLSFPR